MKPRFSCDLYQIDDFSDSPELFVDLSGEDSFSICAVHNLDDSYGIFEEYEVMSYNKYDASHIIIPLSIEYAGAEVSVYGIGLCAFKDHTELSEVILSQSIHYIGNHAFSGCLNLRKIHLNQGLRSIDDGAFASCTSLSEINIPDSVTSIGSKAFAFCTSLRKISLPPHLEHIDLDAFIGCHDLTIEINADLFSSLLKTEKESDQA